MDAQSIWQLVDAGGALGALVVFAGYLVYQNRELWRENRDHAVRQHETELRNHERELRNVEALSGFKHAIERLADKING